MSTFKIDISSVYLKNIAISSIRRLPDKRNSAAWNDPLLDCCSGGIQSIGHAIFLLIHFNFGGATNLQLRNALAQFGQSLAQLNEYL